MNLRQIIKDYLKETYNFQFSKAFPPFRDRPARLVNVICCDHNLICNDLDGRRYDLDYADPIFFDKIDELITTGFMTHGSKNPG